MIYKHELRIGNIFWENYGGFKIVTQIRRGDVCATALKHTTEGAFDFEHIYGVPLDEEWLDKFGIKQIDEISKWYLGKLIIDKCNDVFFIEVSENPDMDIPIPFVHTLQNASYYIKAIELTIKD